MLTELNQQILKFKTSTVYIELKFWNITLSKPKVPTTSIRSFRLQKNIKFLKHPFFYPAQQKHSFFSVLLKMGSASYLRELYYHRYNFVRH